VSRRKSSDLVDFAKEPSRFEWDFERRRASHGWIKLAFEASEVSLEEGVGISAREEAELDESSLCSSKHENSTLSWIEIGSVTFRLQRVVLPLESRRLFE